MSRRSRPQPITAPAPESFLPTFDFDAQPKPRTSAPLPPRKPVKLSKRLAAFTFLNLEDIVEEGDDSDRHGKLALATASVDPLSPAISHTSPKPSRFWDFSRTKHTTPITPTDLPPMSSKAYATLIGGPVTPGSGSKALFSPPPSKVIRTAASPKSTLLESPISKKGQSPIGTEASKGNPKSLAVDLVSIFSLTTSDETDAYNTRFSFPMPPNFTPRRGSQSPLDPEVSFNSIQSPISPLSPDSATSGGSDRSFFSPLFSAGFAVPAFPPDTIVIPEEPVPPVPEKTTTVKDVETAAQKRRSMRPVLSLIPPAGPPPRESPPSTPTSATDSPHSADRLDALAAAAKRICPSPDLDPELSATSATTSIASILLGSGTDSPAEQTDAEEDTDRVDIFGDWTLGAPSRSGSIVTITQRAINDAIRRGSLPSPAFGNGGRNASIASDMYDNWEQAIDDIFAIVSTNRRPSLTASRRPSLASIAMAASAAGAASANTSMDVVEDTAFVMDDDMMRKFMESQFLVPSRVAPAPPSPTSATSSLCGSPSNSSASLATATSTSMDATPSASASATSSARSSFEEDSSSNGYSPAKSDTPLTPIQEEHVVLESDPTLLSRPRLPRPAPVIATQSYPPVGGLRINKIRPELEHSITLPAPVPARPKRTPPLVTGIVRPPPSQSVPDESAFFSPSSINSYSPFSPPPDIDSWPTWSSIDNAIEAKRNARRPSAGAVTMMSKFSDDSIDVSKPRKRSGTRTKPKKVIAEGGEDPLEARLRKNGMIATKTLNPGSSYTTYNFLGMKKKRDSPVSSNTSPTSTTANGVIRSPKEAKPRTSLESNNSGSSDGKRNGLKRPPLPLELFIRA